MLRIIDSLRRDPSLYTVELNLKNPEYTRLEMKKLAMEISNLGFDFIAIALVIAQYDIDQMKLGASGYFVHSKAICQGSIFLDTIYI